ncbi:MAG: hypothetical protein QOJ79_1678 [Actinomycetota bacterium]|nr:hypothetical protein [Actinomycetota bacterium]
MPAAPGSPGGDWQLPQVDPADGLIGWSPEPALPEAVPPAPPPAPPRLPATAAVGHPNPFAGVGEPLISAAAEEPPSAEELSAEEPPSAGVLPVPRRSSLPGGPVSPVRALAGAAVAVAGVLLGIGALLWATDAPSGSPALQQTQAQSSDVSPSPSPLPSPSVVPTAVAPAPVATTAAATPSAQATPKLALTVLNNSNVNQLAHRAAAKFRARGWPIKLEGAFRGRIPVTTVYYAPGQQASAQLLQKEFPAIQRVRPRFSTLPGSGLTVVLTRDYPA